jgi:proteasome lid subunit RPN8/RPN11
VSDPAPPVRIAATALAAMRAEAARAYPHEGCGALVGPGPHEVTEAVALMSREAREPRRRFSVDPLDYLAVEESADARGLRLLGFWHSHPDHPARPSATDREYAWEGFLTAVLAVAGGQPGELTLWEVDGEGSGFRPRAWTSDPEGGGRPASPPRKEDGRCPSW